MMDISYIPVQIVLKIEIGGSVLMWLFGCRWVDGRGKIEYANRDMRVQSLQDEAMITY